MKRILIVDQTRDRSALAAARALHADGWTVGTGGWRPTLSTYSRCAERYHRIEEAEGDEDRFIADIAAAVKEGGYDVVVCTYETGIMALSRRRAEVAPAGVGYAAHDVVMRAFDKLAFTRAAEEAGLEVPRTVEATDEELSAWQGPVVVKSRQHLPTRFGTGVFEDATAARSFVADMRAADGQPLLQERVQGRLGAVVVVADESSEVVAEVHQVAVHSWPPDAGDTVRGRTIPIDPGRSARVRQLVRATGWVGIAQLEFLLDGSNTPRFTDFNGRFYGSIALAGRAGVNVAACWARVGAGLPLSAAPVPKIGARYQWLNRDLAASRAADGWRGVATAVALAPVSAHSVGSLRDPGPIVRFLVPELARRAWRRASAPA
jgi:predicted ATP-grasp superfamily ATP-dependent carboligase